MGTEARVGEVGSVRGRPHLVGDELRERVTEAMGRIGAGEKEAIWDLHLVAEPALTRMLRAEARRIDFRIGDEDLFDLTLDAAVELGRLAGSWNPEGALPWVWAKRRIAGLVHSHIGTFADELDATHLDLEAQPEGPAMDEPRLVLRNLGRRHAGARQLDEELSIQVTERDADIWIGVQIEKAVGNRSPAVTIAAEHGLRPAAVRKVVQRVTERLAAVA